MSGGNHPHGDCPECLALIRELRAARAVVEAAKTLRELTRTAPFGRKARDAHAALDAAIVNTPNPGDPR